MAEVPAFHPTRTQFYGIRTANPTLPPDEDGAWWYRSDLNHFCYWDGATVHCWGGVGGIFFTGTGDFVIPVAGGCVNGSITISGCTTINFLVNLVVTATDPPVCDVYTPQRASIVGNVVGISLGGVTGTTVSVQALVAGY